MLGILLALQDPTVVHVGRVTAIFWEGDTASAITLAELADRMTSWPGIPHPPQDPIRLILPGTDARFDSLTRGHVPEWGAGATLPSARTIVLRRRIQDPRRVLRHELAHLTLHSVAGHVPRWFAEGYASRAAGEWSRVQALRVNWAVLRGAVPSLPELSRHLRSSAEGEADAAYALATTAVRLLERLGGERGLEPILTNLAATVDFDQALRATNQLTLGQFEERWRRDLRQRYGWLLLVTSFTGFWALAAVVLTALWMRRKRRDRARRAALDEGWIVADDQWNGYA